MPNVKDVMMILEDECKRELECARRTKELLRRTRNPFRRMQLKSHYKIFIDHSIGIQQAIYRIKRELEP